MGAVEQLDDAADRAALDPQQTIRPRGGEASRCDDGTTRPHVLTEFLDWEQAQLDRWEFADGYAWPMAGTTDAHGQIVLNLGTLIRVKLRGTDCRAYPNTVKIVAAGRSPYPDIVVTCDPRDRTDRYVKRHPRLLVEVLSKTTAGDDLSDKFAAYRSIETLAEYFTPDRRKRAVQLWRRNVHGHWELVEDRTDGEVHLETLDLTVTFSELYEDVEFEADGGRAQSRDSGGR